MTILLVEDDDSIAIVITAALEAEGFAVVRCDHTDDANHMSRSSNVDRGSSVNWIE